MAVAIALEYLAGRVESDAQHVILDSTISVLTSVFARTFYLFW